MVRLPALNSKVPVELSVKGKNTLTVQDVLVGEVWLCSGQSNMAMSVKSSNNADQEIAAATYPKIRLFTVERVTAETPQADCKGTWVECSPKEIGQFSAAAYFFGRHLHEELGVPVGLINSSWGGTPVEAWTSLDVMQADPSLKPLFERWEKMIASYPKMEPVWKARYQKQLKEWPEAVKKAKAEGKQIPRRPMAPQPPKTAPGRPANLFNAMIAPLVPYSIRGALWYQGEANISRAWQYRTVLSMMIRDWRARFACGDFGFGVVQIAPFTYRNQDPAWCAELREAQTLMVKTLPNVGLAVTMDIGDLKDIHPKNKQEVGRRLALWALARLYGRNLVYSGPTYESVDIDGNKARIRFSNLGGGLTTNNGQAPNEFIIAGADRKFVPATAVIEGNCVVVSSPEVAAPVAVRYAWRYDSVPNLVNKEGLPAVPFHTDSWKWLTEGNN
jgi:sialate O-acetylesterase